MVGDGADIVIAAVEREDLSPMLTVLHRGGFGHLTRVLDPARGEVGGQLARAGATVPVGFMLGEGDRVAVMISAAARTPAATDLLRRFGAISIWTTQRTASASPILFGPPAGRPRVRSGRATEPIAD